MNRSLAFALGPELIWAALFFVASLLVARNQPPTLAGNQRLELILWFLPLAGVLLSFVPLAWNPGNPWVLLSRIAGAGLIGLYLVVTHMCGGIDYNDSRNSGVGTAFVLFLMLGTMALFAGVCITAITFFIKDRLAGA